jgi:hypothetical protein
MFGAVVSPAQSAAPPNPPAALYGQNPEDAYLSATRYTNAHFGFSFDFPDALKLRPMPQPASPDRRIQLLELSGSTTAHPAISIGVYEHKTKNYTDAKTLLRRQLDQELFHGVEELHGISKTTVGNRQFYYFEARQGVDQHISLAGEVEDYVLQIDLRTRDPKLLKDLQADIVAMEFFSAHDAGKHCGSIASPYQGPAISAEHLRQIRETVPAESIDPGKVTAGVYRNAQVGLSYQIPPGWDVQPVGAIEPAVERYREKMLGEPLLGPRERALVKLCRKTLVSAWRTKPDSDGQVPYDDFGEVTLSALPLSCFPNIRFPNDIQDAASIREFVMGMNISQPLQRDMTSASAFTADGKLYVVTRGTIAYKEQGDSLSRRVSVSLVMAEQRGYLLIWLFAAPHEAEMRELMSAKVNFEAPFDAQSPAVASTPQAAPVRSGTAPAPPPSSDDATTPSSPPAPSPAEAAFHPSLLRSGEQAKTPSAEQKPAPNQPN